jgi:hypothetical protein
MHRGLFDELAEASFADRTVLRFEPVVMAQDLGRAVELLAAAIQAIPADLLNSSEVERLVASLDASFEAFRQIRRNLRTRSEQLSGSRSCHNSTHARSLTGQYRRPLDVESASTLKQALSEKDSLVKKGDRRLRS